MGRKGIQLRWTGSLLPPLLTNSQYIFLLKITHSKLTFRSFSHTVHYVQNSSNTDNKIVVVKQQCIHNSVQL